MHNPRSADHVPLPPFSRWELGRLVDAWAERGHPLPVAVVVSIIDDVCEALSAAPPGDDGVVSLEHVIIDQAGIARITVRPREAVPAVSSLLRAALSAGRGDEAIPAAAWPVVGLGLADDPWVRPASTDVIQQQLREALGPPAAREEVLGCCEVMRDAGRAPVRRSVPPVDVDLESLAPRGLGARPTRDEVRAVDPVLVMGPDPYAAATDVVLPLEVPSMVGPASELPIRVEATSGVGAASGVAHVAASVAPVIASVAPVIASAAPVIASAAPVIASAAPAIASVAPRPVVARAIEESAALVPPPLPGPAAALVPPPLPGPAAAAVPEPSASPRTAVTATLPEDLEGPPSLLPKPVVRHEPPRRRPVSLPTAPAARLGPSLSPGPGESGIELPSDGPAQRILIGVLALATALLVAWLLGLL